VKPDQILTDVFNDQAEYRPDPIEVLAGVRHRLDHSSRPSVTRAATALSAAAAVAVTAVAVTALGDRDGNASQHSGGSRVVGAATQHSAPRPAHTVRPVTTPSPRRRSGSTRARSKEDYSTIAAGWLPGPGQQVEASNQPGFEERDYDVTVDGVDMDVIIYLESGQLPSATEAGSGYTSVTINGHPGRQFVADNATIVAFDLGNGEVAYAGPSVDAPTDTVTTARITDIAVHVATAMEFNQHDPIPAAQRGGVKHVIGPARHAAQPSSAG
jgi:hypothetical protein